MAIALVVQWQHLFLENIEQLLALLAVAVVRVYGGPCGVIAQPFSPL